MAEEKKAASKAAPKTEPVATREPVGTNWLALPFPTDPHGTCKALRDGGIAAVRRINGNPEKYQRFRDTLSVLIRFADEVYAQDTQK